jgi:flagellar M-ring protein FliF
VRAARVHLVLPRREPFAREEQPAQASVLLTMSGSSRLDKQGVQAVVNLVAAAVPGLRPQNIAIIDSRGDLLARAGEPVGDSVTPMNAEEIRRATELRLSRAVEEMLERSLGPGHVRAEAAVEMSFNRLHETEERYDPDGQVARSQQSTTDNSRSTENNNTVSVQNNLPNADTGQNGSGSQEQKQDETTNYEISKTVRTLVNDAPQIKRISLAVMVDGVLGHGPDGKPVWQERSADELARITALVKSAIGFDDKRGDKVEIASLRFTGADDMPAAPVGMFGAFEKADLMRLAQTLLFGIVGVLALLLVLRPMVLRLTATPTLAGPGGSGHNLAALPAPGMTGSVAGQITAASLSGTPLLEDESMVDVANIEGQMRASSIRRIADMVEKHPDESIAIVRGWMAQEQH